MIRRYARSPLQERKRTRNEFLGSRSGPPTARRKSTDIPPTADGRPRGGDEESEAVTSSPETTDARPVTGPARTGRPRVGRLPDPGGP